MIPTTVAQFSKQQQIIESTGLSCWKTAAPITAVAQHLLKHMQSATPVLQVTFTLHYIIFMLHYIHISSDNYVTSENPISSSTCLVSMASAAVEVPCSRGCKTQMRICSLSTYSGVGSPISHGSLLKRCVSLFVAQALLREAQPS